MPGSPLLGQTGLSTLYLVFLAMNQNTLLLLLMSLVVTSGVYSFVRDTAPQAGWRTEACPSCEKDNDVCWGHTMEDSSVHQAQRRWDACYGVVSRSGCVRMSDLRQLMGDKGPGFRVYFALPDDTSGPGDVNLIITAIDSGTVTDSGEYNTGYSDVFLSGDSVLYVPLVARCSPDSMATWKDIEADTLPALTRNWRTYYQIDRDGPHNTIPCADSLGRCGDYAKATALGRLDNLSVPLGHMFSRKKLEEIICTHQSEEVHEAKLALIIKLGLAPIDSMAGYYEVELFLQFEEEKRDGADFLDLTRPCPKFCGDSSVFQTD